MCPTSLKGGDGEGKALLPRYAGGAVGMKQAEAADVAEAMASIGHVGKKLGGVERKRWKAPLDMSHKERGAHTRQLDSSAYVYIVGLPRKGTP